MFVIVISGGYATSDNPLLGIFAMDQARALQNCGHQVVLISIDLRSIRRKRKLGFTHLVSKSIKIYNFSFPLGRVPKRLLFYVGRIGIQKLFKQIIEQYGKPDVIHAHFTEIAAIASVLKCKYDIPFVVTEHSSLINKKKISMTASFWGRKAYCHADQIICVSSALAKKVSMHFNKNSIIVPNIADNEEFVLTQAEKDKFIFISVGSLTYGKGFDVLLHAFAAGFSNGNVLLYIIGGGKYRKTLEKQIKKLNIRKQVKLFGILPRQQIQEMFAISSVFILTSRAETFGVAYIEAMSAGLPVIATRCGGPEDFVNEENGLLVNVNDIDDTAIAMNYMYQNISRYDSVKISNEIKKQFAPETIAQQLTGVYQNIQKI